MACRTPEPPPIDNDGDGVVAVDDCNDNDAAVLPGATELCDGIDNDCEGTIDVNATDALTFYADADADGSGNDASTTTACDAPRGFVAQAGDCDDGDSAKHPGAPEDDCTDPTDYNCDGSVGYADADADGYPACEDCNDDAPAISPAGVEVCDGVDNDCDGQADDDAVNALRWHADADDDGFGDASAILDACDQPAGYVSDATDCDDSAATRFPGADERCNAVDDDCNGLTDEDAVDAATWYMDADEDGAGATRLTFSACEQPPGYVSAPGDCDDLRAETHPGATEACDGLDNDCDGSVPAEETATVYLDADGDGHGNPRATLGACGAPAGWVADNTDCDDANDATYPGAQEICDTLDNDCDGNVPASELTLVYADADGDSYGNVHVAREVCNAPTGWVADSTDCDDTRASTSPSALDRPGDGVDNNCDGADTPLAIYVAARFSGDVWAINRLNGRRLWTANIGDESIDTAVGPDGTVYASLYGTGGVVMISADGQTVTPLTTALPPGTHGLTYDFARDVLLVADGAGVWEVDPVSGAERRLFEHTGVIGAIRMEGDDRVLFTDRVNRQVLRWDPLDGTFDVLATLPLGPNFLVPASDGRLYTSAITELYLVDPVAKTWETVSASLPRMAGICADPLRTDDLLWGDHDKTLRGAHISPSTATDFAVTAALDTPWGCASNALLDDDGDGFNDRARGGADCDDHDPERSPGQPDLAGDLFDQNCDFVDGVDADGDGVASIASGGTDCDDADATVFPGTDTCAAKSCLALHTLKPNAPSGVYAIDPAGAGAFQNYCDMTTDGGGWSLVWKHAYLEVGPATDAMRFYSTVDTPCTSLYDAWCNVPNKAQFGATEMRVSAHHTTTSVWDYKGDFNPKLDVDWTGGQMANWGVIEDRCTVGTNVNRPEPEIGGHAFPGVTWDKWNNGDFVSNCDTDRYGPAGTGTSDCRWENCGLPSSISGTPSHVQETVHLWVR